MLHIIDIIAATGTRVALPSQLTYLYGDTRRSGDSSRFDAGNGEQKHRLFPEETWNQRRGK